MILHPKLFLWYHGNVPDVAVEFRLIQLMSMDIGHHPWQAAGHSSATSCNNAWHLYAPNLHQCTSKCLRPDFPNLYSKYHNTTGEPATLPEPSQIKSMLPIISKQYNLQSQGISNNSVTLPEAMKLIHDVCFLWWAICMIFTLLALCEGNLPIIGRFPSQKASNANLLQFLCCQPEKLLNKQLT